MFFFLKYPLSSGTRLSVSIEEGTELPTAPMPGTVYVQAGVQRLETIELACGKLLLMGDPVFENKKSLPAALITADGGLNDRAVYEMIKGHFYWFHIHSNGLRCGTSFGAIFPVYFHQTGEQILISSSSFCLAEKLDTPVRNRRNLLERLLFNYPFFSSTWWEEISLLEAHRYLDLSFHSATVAGDFELTSCFGKPEMYGRESLSYLAQVFQQETELFFPDEPFGISMTGGFDGRTLVAAAIQSNQHFFTYSFGRAENSDVTFPMSQAQRLGLKYFPIYLDDNYVKQDSLSAAESLMKLTEFNGNYGRPHYEFAARKLAKKTRYIVTGNFGSELFRALHLPGVMMSECLINFFASTDSSWKDFLQKTTEKWDALFFRNELEALLADLENYLQKTQGWEPNHRFYHFVFSEISRKYFGPELVMQSHYLRNRTPFLNLHFFKELNRTSFSGVHSRLFEKNKGKRMKGQMFYAAFLRQASPELYRLPTNKGYSPADVLEPWRWPWLAVQIGFRKFLKSEEMDDHSVEAFFKMHHPALRQQTSCDPFFQTHLRRSAAAIAKGEDLEKWIKFYSITAGWQAASHVSRPAPCSKAYKLTP